MLEPGSLAPPVAASTVHWLFDLDGTLVDTAPDIARALNRLLASRGLAPASLLQVTDWIGTGSLELIRVALQTQPAAHAAATTGTVDAATLQTLLARYAADYAAHAVVDSVLYPDARSTVLALRARGDRLAIVTNKLAAVARAVLAHFKLADCFEVVIGGDDVLHGKPDPMALLEACRRLGVPPVQCTMVGDSRNDVLAARAAGMRVVAVSYGYNHGVPIRDAQPDRLVDSLAMLL